MADLTIPTEVVAIFSAFTSVLLMSLIGGVSFVVKMVLDARVRQAEQSVVILGLERKIVEVQAETQDEAHKMQEGQARLLVLADRLVERAEGQDRRIWRLEQLNPPAPSHPSLNQEPA